MDPALMNRGQSHSGFTTVVLCYHPKVDSEFESQPVKSASSSVDNRVDPGDFR